MANVQHYRSSYVSGEEQQDVPPLFTAGFDPEALHHPYFQNDTTSAPELHRRPMTGFIPPHASQTGHLNPNAVMVPYPMDTIVPCIAYGHAPVDLSAYQTLDSNTTVHPPLVNSVAPTVNPGQSHADYWPHHIGLAPQYESSDIGLDIHCLPHNLASAARTNSATTRRTDSDLSQYTNRQSSLFSRPSTGSMVTTISELSFSSDCGYPSPEYLPPGACLVNTTNLSWNPTVHPLPSNSGSFSYHQGDESLSFAGQRQHQQQGFNDTMYFSHMTDAIMTTEPDQLDAGLDDPTEMIQQSASSSLSYGSTSQINNLYSPSLYHVPLPGTPQVVAAGAPRRVARRRSPGAENRRIASHHKTSNELNARDLRGSILVEAKPVTSSELRRKDRERKQAKAELRKKAKATAPAVAA